ncbi:hypothetical protein KLK06_04620 [Nonomuraea sp. NEAU-A123]|nr:hypothetical protein [Nonomuraea sp. NEAU-A123]MBT2225134.1 hypothetical protein [Nonomuraea sp. NEAU-A123]
MTQNLHYLSHRVERFLESVQAVTTRTGYAETLARLTVVAGPQYPVAALTPEQYAAVMDRWTAAARCLVDGSVPGGTRTTGRVLRRHHAARVGAHG